MMMMMMINIYITPSPLVFEIRGGGLNRGGREIGQREERE
jgi:hypothetical protein